LNRPSLAYRLLLASGLLLATAQIGSAQPDTAPRNIAPPVGKPPLTLAEVQTLTGGPTLITFAGQNVPLVDIVKLFQSASGLQNPPARKIAVALGMDKTISVDWKGVPFWDAAREVETLSGLRWGSRIGGVLELSPPATSESMGLSGLMVAKTPFVTIVANGVTHTSVAKSVLGPKVTSTTAPALTSAIAPTRNDSTQISLSIYLDPRLPLENNRLRAGRVRLSTPGTPLSNVTSVSSSPSVQPNPNPLLAAMQLNLNTGIKSGTRIAAVNATLQMDVVQETQTWKVADLLLAPPANQYLAGADRSFEGAQMQGRQLKVTLGMTRDVIPNPQIAVRPDTIIGGTFIGDSNSALAFRARPFGAAERVQVFDAQGRELKPAGAVSTSTTRLPGAKEKATGVFSFATTDPAGQEMKGPYQLEWNIIAATRILDVPLEVRDVPVP
jgi:hypothetical protein